MKKLFVVAVLAVLTACGGAPGKQGEDTQTDSPLSQSKNSPDFNSKFTTFLNNYYHLKDAFVLSNNDMAVTSANLLFGSADSINLKEVKADNSIIEMAKGYLQTVSTEAKAISKVRDIETNRKSFQMISDAMYDLIRTVRFDNGIVYQQFCPMAFNDAGAFWLSSSSDIKNPYFGKKMLTCGEVKDSVDFRAK